MDKTTMATNMSVELLQGCEKAPELRLKKARSQEIGSWGQCVYCTCCFIDFPGRFSWN